MFWGSSKYRSLKLLQAVKVINKNNEHKNNAISFNFFIVSPIFSNRNIKTKTFR